MTQQENEANDPDETVESEHPVANETKESSCSTSMEPSPADVRQLWLCQERRASVKELDARFVSSTQTSLRSFVTEDGFHQFVQLLEQKHDPKQKFLILRVMLIKKRLRQKESIDFLIKRK